MNDKKLLGTCELCGRTDVPIINGHLDSHTLVEDQPYVSHSDMCFDPLTNMLSVRRPYPHNLMIPRQILIQRQKERYWKARKEILLLKLNKANQALTALTNQFK